MSGSKGMEGLQCLVELDAFEGIGRSPQWAPKWDAGLEPGVVGERVGLRQTEEAQGEHCLACGYYPGRSHFSLRAISQVQLYPTRSPSSGYALTSHGVIRAGRQWGGTQGKSIQHRSLPDPATFSDSQELFLCLQVEGKGG